MDDLIIPDKEYAKLLVFKPFLNELDDSEVQKAGLPRHDSRQHIQIQGG